MKVPNGFHMCCHIEEKPSSCVPIVVVQPAVLGWHTDVYYAFCSLVTLTLTEKYIYFTIQGMRPGQKKHT